VLLSLLLCTWIDHPRKWMNWTFGALYLIAIGLPLLGLLARPH
jgi:hypothetical protein